MVEAQKPIRANVGSLMLFQLFSRLITFVGNTLILRMASPLVLGIASVKLDLYIGTVLSLARDGVRMALIRMEKPERNEEDRGWLGRFTSLSAMSIPIGLVVSSVLGAVLLRWPPLEVQQSDVLMAHYKSSIIYYSFSSLLELLAEPFVAVFIYTQKSKPRLLVELISLGARMITLLYVIGNRTYSDEVILGMKAFSFGQLARSLTFTIGMLFAFQQQFPQYSPMDFIPLRFAERNSFGHAWEMTKQLVLKYALAQGDMWIISTSSTISSQGVYSVVINYGSLVCRLLLQPLEESGLHYFSQTLVSSKSATDKKNAFRHLELILKFDLLLSLVFVGIAPWYTKPLVHLMLGRRWASTNMPAVLAAYCLQIPSMAYCGILEAFMNSTLTSDWYQTVKHASVGFSLLYIGAALVLVRRFETFGLIAAGAFSFALRAALGFYYLRGYMRQQNVQYTLNPWLKRPTLIAIVLTSIISAALFQSQLSVMNLVAGGGACAATLAVSLTRWERPFVHDLRRAFIGQKLKST